MAPRKEAAEKATGERANDLILNYLREQNRPYSATDISANLHNKVTKAATAKILKDLHEKKEIEGRASGKQLVYHAIQPTADPTTDTSTQLAELDTRLASLRTETSALTTHLRQLKSELATRQAHTSTPIPVLHARAAALERERDELVERLAPLRAGAVPPVDRAEREAVVMLAKKWKGVEARRRRIAKELWDMIREGLPDGVAEADVRERLGLDE